MPKSGDLELCHKLCIYSGLLSVFFFLEWEFLSNSCFIIYSSGIRANSCCWTFCSPWARVDTCSCHFCSPHDYRGPLAGTLHPPPHAPPSPMGLFVGSMCEEPEPAATTGQTFMDACLKTYPKPNIKN